MSSRRVRLFQAGWLRVLFVGLMLIGRGATAQPAADAPPEAAPAGQSPAPPAAPSADAGAEEDRKRSEAKERFVRGLSLANDGSWDAALVEFQASIELFPTRVAMTNAAISLRNLKRYAEAVAMYREYLQRFGEQLPPEEKRQIDDSIGELRAYIGEIDVETREKGATVVVDGQERGRTPLAEPIAVNAGTHSLRVSKQGFQPFEAQIAVAGKQRKLVSAELRPLMKSGTLVVNEADGKVLEVVVDGAVVGKTPWQGLVAVGVHSVALRGEGDMGTAPSSAEVRENQSTQLALRAQKLDAELRVEPVPTNARVQVDGVAVGTGVWQGRLTSGEHRVEVAAEGHIAFERKVAIKIGQREILRVSLERDLTDPMWGKRFRPHLYVELLGGAALAPSLGGSSDTACKSKVQMPDGSSADGCSDRPLSIGGLGGARGGYQLTSGLGLELFVGYLYLKAERTRAVVGNLDDLSRTPLGAKDYADSVTLSGLTAAAAASYQMLDFLIGRLSVGVVRARVQGENSGTFSGPRANPDDATDIVTFTRSVTIPEAVNTPWIPFIAPEAQFRYRVSDRFSLELGVSAFVMFPSGTPRTGGSFPDSARRNKALLANGDTFANDANGDGEADEIQTSLFSLPREEALGTFLAVVPALGARIDF